MKAQKKTSQITSPMMKQFEPCNLLNSSTPDLHSYLRRVKNISGLTEIGVDHLYSTLITYNGDQNVLDTAKNIIRALQAFPIAERTSAIKTFQDVTRATIPEKNLLKGSQELLENVIEDGTKNWELHVDNCFKPTKPQIPTYSELNSQPADYSLRIMHPPSELFKNGNWR